MFTGRVYSMPLLSIVVDQDITNETELQATWKQEKAAKEKLVAQAALQEER